MALKLFLSASECEIRSAVSLHPGRVADQCDVGSPDSQDDLKAALHPRLRGILTIGRLRRYC